MLRVNSYSHSKPAVTITCLAGKGQSVACLTHTPGILSSSPDTDIELFFDLLD